MSAGCGIHSVYFMTVIMCAIPNGNNNIILTSSVARHRNADRILEGIHRFDVIET